MTTQMFVNLPVRDLDKSIAFFTKLGFLFDPQFTDENATCMIIGENSFVMLLVENFFKTFTHKQIADAQKTSEVIVALSMDSKEQVNVMVQKALEAGGVNYKEPDDQDVMYGWGFQDLDGHLWEVIYMEPSAMDQS
ncbi:VOC family protein [Candidatus Roizmanbacteria bacterium]|nr:VOC family protein [Candidatus Roizmanbacteria bacterium]